MRKLFRTFLLAAFAVLAVSATDLTVQAAETTTEVTQATKVALTDASKAALKMVFDAKYYAQAYPDVVAVLGDSEDVLFAHYTTNGINEGRDASATFNASIYALANADLAEVFGDDTNALVQHYIDFGINEKRIATTDAYLKNTNSVTPANTIANSSLEIPSIVANSTSANTGRYSVTFLGTGHTEYYNSSFEASNVRDADAQRAIEAANATLDMDADVSSEFTMP